MVLSYRILLANLLYGCCSVAVKLTLQELIELTQGSLIQQGKVTEFTGMNALNEAEASEVSFLGNEKYFPDFLATQAGLVLVPTGLPELPAGVTLLQVENPSFAFGAVVKKFSTKLKTFVAGVHPSAYVADDVEFDPTTVSIRAGAIIESGCVIGAGSEIGAGVVVGENVEIGQECLLHSNATVREYCVLGDRVRLQPGCVIGSDGYGYELIEGRHAKVDQVGIVVLEDDVEIGANTTIDRARFGKTVIGEGTKVDNLVQVAHNVQTGKHCLIVSQSGLAGSSKLGHYVTVAAQAGVAGHIEVGDKAVLMGRAGVAKNLEGGQIYMGFPARPVKEEQKKLASLARLPKAMIDLRELKKAVKALQPNEEK